MDAAGSQHAAAEVPVVRVEHLSKVYHPGTPGEVRALDDVSFEIHGGEFLAIMGPSGAGKSPRMNMIGCLDTPSAGRYLCDGVDVATLDAEQRAQLRLSRIGFVFQGFHLLPRMSALENVMLPLVYAGVPRAQRAAIARALINAPPVLLAAAPTGALDSRTSEEILALFQRLRDAGHTVILITHEAEVADHADRVIHIRDGRLDEGHAGVKA